MANPFAQFVQPKEEQNPFAQFVQPKEEQNPFAQFAQFFQPQEQPVEPPKPEEDDSIWTKAADFAKYTLGSAVSGFASIPKGLEEGAKGAVRKAATGEVDVREPMPLVAGKALTRKMDELLRGKDKQSEDAVALERTLAKAPEIPGAAYLRDLGKQTQQSIQASVSEQSKRAVKESEITGNIFKGEIDFGENPTVRGYAMQLASVFGSLAPTLITAVATKSPTAGGVAGGAMAADEAATKAEEFIGKMSHEDLMQNSPFYASLIKQGVGQAEAKDLATRKAAESGAIMQGLVATFGDRFTAKLATGALDDMLKKAAGKSVLGRTAAGTVIGMGEEGLQETTEGLAADIAIQNVAKNKEIGEDSAANLILGMLGGAPVGGVSGLKGALAEKFKSPDTTDQERQSVLDTLAGDMREPTDLFADQEGQQAAPKSQTDLYKQRADEALQTSTQSAKYGDVDQTLPSSNEPPDLFTDVDTGAATTTTSSAPAARAPTVPAQSLEAYRDFVRQYTELRDEYNSLPYGLMDQAGTNLRGLILKDLAYVVDANMGFIRSKGTADQLKNPVFDGSKILARLEPNVGQPRAMQGKLFGTFQAATRLATNALALSSQNSDGAIQELENKRTRMQEKIDSGGYSDADIISRRPAGMTPGQALKNRESILQNLLRETSAEIDQAIDIVQKRTGQPRAMQGNLFSSQQRADTLESEKTRLTQALDTARAELKRMQDLAARPAGETRPSPETIAKLTSDIASYERNLQGVLRDLERANQDVAAGIEPTIGRERQETAAQTEMFDTAELQQENTRVMRERRAAAGEEPREVTERRKRAETTVDEYADLEKDKPAKTVREGKKPPEKSVKAVESEEEAIDHVRRTPEGRLISSFFNVVESQNQEEGEKTRHGESKNTAEDELLEFDLTKPGEFSSTGVNVALKYLADRVGGMDKLRELIGALQSTNRSNHSTLYKKYGLPDLSTRRGMDTFRDETLEHFSQAFGTEGGVRIKRPLGRAPATGEFKGVIPYEEDIKSGVTTTRSFDSMVADKPREPETVTREIVRKISDNKLRSAALVLKQLRDSGKKISAGAQAAITYLSNTHRSTFGEALRDLAFDLAYFEIDPKGHGAGSLFYKEGGQYAKDFREWVKQNLNEETLQLLDELVEEHKQNAAENKKYATAKKAYDDKLAAVQDRRRSQEKEELEELKQAKRKKKTRKERAASMQEAEVEAGESEETLEPFTAANTKNLPTVQMLTEVLTELHPSIVRTLEKGDTRAALELLVQAKNNRYYSELAQRILDTGFTAKTRLISQNTLESLSNDPQVTESLNKRIEALQDLVVTLYPQEQQTEIIAGLKSGELSGLIAALDTVRDTLKKNGGTQSNQQLFDSVEDLVNREFSWNGKYDPASDTIVIRRGEGRLTNHLLLHESIHAATSYLIDNADSLVGIQRQGYERLNELFQYSKGLLEQKGITVDTVYGLQDLHEFVSEALTNPELQALLRSIRYKAAPFSLWNRFTNSVREMFKVKPGDPSNVMVEVMFAADAMMAGTMSLEGVNVTTGPKAMARRRTTVPPGMPNQPSTIRRWMMADTWTSGKMRELRSMNADARKAYLGMLTLRQINDLVGGRIKQIGNFINVTEKFLARKSQILKESGDISRKWERLQAANPDMSRQLGVVMHSATILEIDPDKATLAQRTNNAKLMNDWRALSPEAKTIYREVRNFYERRYSQYKRLMNRRIIQMRQLGVSEATITEIRNEFEKGKRAGPYFPLMRFGRFWYQVGTGKNREYYMFESEAARDMHIKERLKQDPQLATTVEENIGNDYKQQMDFHARESAFLKSAFAGVDSMDMTGLTQAEAEKRRTELKDNLYQTYLANQPDRSMRNAFVHRNSIAGYSEDALRSFSSSSFSMAYQMSRFEYSPEMFSQLDAARAQIKGRFTPGASYDPALVRENDELRDYIGEIDKRLVAMLNPTDTGKWVSYLSNIGFIYYLTSIGSAVINVMGGAMIGVPTLIGQQVRANPKIGYTEATGRVLYNTFKTMAQITATGFGIERGGRVIDSKLLSPSLDRSKTMSAVDRAAYNRFVADGLIDITAAYDQSGLASSPTSDYSSIPNRAMQIVAYAFHHAERFNREVVAMSAFRSAMEKRAKYPNQQQAFAEAVAEAKDLTQRSMFDYSEPNKPRFLQNAPAKIIFQFKQFPQHMTFFLARNAWNSFGRLPEAEKREARARFVGTMGMAAIFSGVTGLWGFSTVAFIVNAVANAGDDDEPFDFELEFANWAVDTFGVNMGTMVSRGVGNAAGVDLHSRLKLDGMWLRDGRDNQDAEAAVQSFIVGILGPLAGLTVSAGRAVDLYNKGHADRAIETMLPGFAKQPMIAARYGKEGALTLGGDIMKKEFTPFELMMQSLGIRPADLAEIQFRNIKVKGQEQKIVDKRQNLLNIFALTFMTNDPKGNEEALEKIMEFNRKYPTLALNAESLIKSIKGKLEKSAQADHGLYIDPKLRHLFTDTYIKKITEKGDKKSTEENPFAKFATQE